MVFSNASLQVHGLVSHHRPLLHTPGGRDCHTPLWLGPPQRLRVQALEPQCTPIRTRPAVCEIRVSSERLWG